MLSTLSVLGLLCSVSAKRTYSSFHQRPHSSMETAQDIPGGHCQLSVWCVSPTTAVRGLSVHLNTSRSIDHNPSNGTIIGQGYYLEVERLFHPGPWKQTLRHRKNRSSQYVDLAVGAHPKHTGERVPHSTTRLVYRTGGDYRILPDLSPTMVHGHWTIVLSCPCESLWYCTLPAPVLFGAAADFQENTSKKTRMTTSRRRNLIGDK